MEIVAIYASRTGHGYVTWNRILSQAASGNCGIH